MPSSHSHSSHSSGGHRSHSSHSHSSHSSSRSSRGPSSHSFSSHTTDDSPKYFDNSHSRSVRTVSYNKPDQNTGRAIQFSTKKKYYRYYDSSWMTRDGVVRPSGYYDMENNRYDGVVTDYVDGHLLKAECSYCGSSVLLKLKEDQNFKCPNCGAPLNIAIDEEIISEATYRENEKKRLKDAETQETWLIVLYAIGVILFFMFVVVSGQLAYYNDSTVPDQNDVYVEDDFGNVLYLDYTPGEYAEITTKEKSNLILYRNSDYDYYDSVTKVYIYRNYYVVDGGIWQYWWEGVSNAYGDYGWMEYDEELNQWFVEVSDGIWEVLPQDKVKDYFWYIREIPKTPTILPPIDISDNIKVTYEIDPEFDSTDGIRRNFCEFEVDTVYCEPWDYQHILKSYPNLSDYYKNINNTNFGFLQSLYGSYDGDGHMITLPDYSPELEYSFTRVDDAENIIFYNPKYKFYIKRDYNECFGSCIDFPYNQGRWVYWVDSISYKYYTDGGDYNAHDNMGWITRDEDTGQWAIYRNEYETEILDEDKTKDLFYLSDFGTKYQLDYEDFLTLLEYKNIQGKSLDELFTVYDYRFDLKVFDIENNTYDIEKTSVNLDMADSYDAYVNTALGSYQVIDFPYMYELRFMLIKPTKGFNFYGKDDLKVLFHIEGSEGLGDAWGIWSYNGKILYVADSVYEDSTVVADFLPNKLDFSKMYFRVCEDYEDSTIPRLVFGNSTYPYYENYESTWYSYSYLH